MSLKFAFNRVKTTNPNFGAVHNDILNRQAEVLPGMDLWGTFLGLFGIGSSEFILVATGEVADVNQKLLAVDGVESVQSLQIEPTVRPLTQEPCTREGLYVFRFFDVLHKDVDEIARLSKEAWEFFEKADDYQAIPQGLFCQQDRSEERGLMLLCTWYDGLTSWQTSRAPDPRASANFRTRAAMTLGTKAYATRLITT